MCSKTSRSCHNLGPPTSFYAYVSIHQSHVCAISTQQAGAELSPWRGEAGSSLRSTLLPSQVFCHRLQISPATNKPTKVEINAKINTLIPRPLSPFDTWSTGPTSEKLGGPRGISAVSAGQTLPGSDPPGTCADLRDSTSKGKPQISARMVLWWYTSIRAPICPAKTRFVAIWE